MRFNNSIGLSLKPNVYQSIIDGPPLLELEYRTLLRSKNRYRISLVAGLKSGEYGASLGWERLLFDSRKVTVYGGADFSYVSYHDDLRSFGLAKIKSKVVDLNAFAGLTYSVTSRIGFFVEPYILSHNIFSSSDESHEIADHKTRFLQTFKIGARMKF